MMLEIQDLHVHYGSIHAVRGVDLAVAEGEIVCLLGANGAGKSSLLGAVAGLETPSAGRVRFKGEDVTGAAPERLARGGIALVPEGRRIFPQLTVAENLRMGAAAERSKLEIARRNEQVWSLFPVLRERRSQRAGVLSGGQQQMLAIGRALMSGPDLLLLDEPSLGLAPIVVEEIFQLVARLRDDGGTVLLIEQDAHRALQVADRAYVLLTGRIQASGSAAAIAESTDLESAYLGARGEPDATARAG